MKSLRTCVALGLLVASSSMLSQGSEPSEAELKDLHRIADFFGHLVADNKLPGLAREDHGDFTGYHLTKDLTAVWLKEKVIEKKMLPDVADGTDTYAFAGETRDKRRFVYFLCKKGDKITLVSAYEQKGGRWVKHRMPEPERRSA